MELLFALPALAFAFLIILMITCADTIVKLQLPEDHGNPPKPSLLPELNRISGDPHFRTFSYIVLVIEFAYLIIAVAFDDRKWDQDLLLLEAGIPSICFALLWIAFRFATRGFWIFVSSILLTAQFMLLISDDTGSRFNGLSTIVFILCYAVVTALQERAAKTKTGIIRDWMIGLQILIFFRSLPSLMESDEFAQILSWGRVQAKGLVFEPVKTSLCLLIPVLFAKETGAEPQPIRWYPDDEESQSNLD